MNDRLERLRQRTNGYTVTPAQYAVAAYLALVALTVIVLTGAAVRLTGSGLGCPTWPKCYGNVYPPLNTHAVIEFSNRVLTAPVSIAAIAAWVLALRRRPYRRELVRLSALLPLGVLAQAILGGLTVRGSLDYGWVMGHFALSMLIIVAAVVLVWRATHFSAQDRWVASGEPSPRPAAVRSGFAGVSLGALRRLTVPQGSPTGPNGGASANGHGRSTGSERALVYLVRALLGMGALTIFAGTGATAAGPHAGGSPGQKINRLSFDGRGTMDFVIHRHAEIAFAFSLLALATWWLARRRGAATSVRRALTALCLLLALQGLVGIDQYEMHLPTELVWIHVLLACLAWIATLFAVLAAGRPAPRRASAASERALAAALRARSPLNFPGN